MSEDPGQPPDVPNRTARDYVAGVAAAGFFAAFVITGVIFHTQEASTIDAIVLLVAFGGTAHFTLAYLDDTTRPPGGTP